MGFAYRRKKVAAFEDANVYTSNFTAGVDGWTASNGTAAGNIDAIGGQDNNLRLTVDGTNGEHYLGRANTITTGNCYRVRLDYYITAAQSNVDQISIGSGSGSSHATGITVGSWASIDAYFYALGAVLYVAAWDGGTGTFQDAGANDVFYIRNVIVDRWSRNPNV